MADMLRYSNPSMVFVRQFECIRCEKKALLAEAPAFCPGCGRPVETVDHVAGPDRAKILDMKTLSVGNVLLN